jgi:hypothetical protein
MPAPSAENAPRLHGRRRAPTASLRDGASATLAPTAPTSNAARTRGTGEVRVRARDCPATGPVRNGAPGCPPSPCCSPRSRADSRSAVWILRKDLRAREAASSTRLSGHAPLAGERAGAPRESAGTRGRRDQAPLRRAPPSHLPDSVPDALDTLRPTLVRDAVRVVFPRRRAAAAVEPAGRVTGAFWRAGHRAAERLDQAQQVACSLSPVLHPASHTEVEAPSGLAGLSSRTV